MSTLVNHINSSLGAGDSIASSYMSIDNCYTAVRIWAYSNQNVTVRIVYADTSVGDNSLAEVYSVYSNHNSAINSTKKKLYAQTIVSNPSDGLPASKVVVKTYHATRDPNPVLTYNTDDVTLQGNFDMGTFEISIGSVRTEVSMSSIQTFGSTVTNAIDNYRAILTDLCGRTIVSCSADTACVTAYGNTVTGTKVPIAVSASGELQVNLAATSLSSSNIYTIPTHIAAGSSTTAMDIGLSSRQVNVMGQSSKVCTLKVRSSPDQITYYDTPYTGIITSPSGTFVFNIPCTERYITVVPSADTSLTLRYTY